MKRLLTVNTVAIVCSLMLSSDARAAFVIDDFTNDAAAKAQDIVTNASPVRTNTSASGSGLSETEREFIAFKLGGDSGEGVTVTTAGNAFLFDQFGSGGPGSASGFGFAVYDGSGVAMFADPYAPDLTATPTDFLQGGGNNSIVLSNVITTGANLDIFIRLFDNVGQDALYGFKDLGNGALGNLQFLFTDFLSNNPALDLANIVAVVLGVDARATNLLTTTLALGPGNSAVGSDISFDQIAVTAVPEPATFAIWTSLCLGLTFIRRRR